MTKIQEKKLKEAKAEALKKIPDELKAIIIDDRKSKVKKSATRILMDMRYECRS